MAEEAADAPLSRRVPGAARRASGKPARPVLSDTMIGRMQAAIHAERGEAEPPRQDDPNTEPLPRVTSAPPASKRAAKHSPSPSGLPPDPVALPGQDAEPEVHAEPPPVAETPHDEPPLRVAKALRVVEPEPPAPAEPVPPVRALPAAAAARANPAEPVPPLRAQPPAAAGWADRAEPEQPLRVLPSAAAAWASSAQPPMPPSPRAAEPPQPPEPPRPMVASASESGSTPGTIGWLWPEETAAQTGGGGPRWRPPGGGGPRWRPPRRWGYRAVTLVTLAAGVLVGAGLFVGIALNSTPVGTGAHGKSTPKATAQPSPTVDPTPSAAPGGGGNGGTLAANLAEAATWVNQQVGSTTLVACDQQSCAALSAVGFPAAQQVRVQENPQAVATAGILIVDPAVTSYLNANPGLANYVTSTILATFGQVTIQVIYPGGVAAYQNALSADVAVRIQIGQQLLNSGQVNASTAAATELQDGDVDPHVLLALQALSAQEPIYVLQFADAGPVASPGAPYRAVDLSPSDAASGLSQSAYVQALIQASKGPNFPTYIKAGSTTLPDGQAAIEVVFGAPSPLNALP